MSDTKYAYAYAEEVCMGTELLHVFETEEARDAWLETAREPEWYLGGRAIHLAEGASAELSDKARTVRHYAEIEYKRRRPIETTDACSAGCPEHYLDLGLMRIKEHLDELFLQAHSAMARCISAMHRYAPTYDNDAALGPIEEIIYDDSFKVGGGGGEGEVGFTLYGVSLPWEAVVEAMQRLYWIRPTDQLWELKQQVADVQAEEKTEEPQARPARRRPPRKARRSIES